MLQVDNDPIILGPCSPLSAAPLTGVTAPTSETKASLTIQTALKIEAKALGALGNAVTVKAEANTSDNLAVSVTGNDLTILLANATGSKNTMTLIAAAIAASTPANALVNAIVITGSTQMTAFTVQSLSGGLNGTAGYLGQVIFDTSGNRWEMKMVSGALYYWSPEGFPANNTEYVSNYDHSIGKIVHKVKVTGSSGANNSTQTIQLPILATQNIDTRSLNGWMGIAGHNRTQYPVFFGTNQIMGTARITRAAGSTGNWLISLWTGSDGNVANRAVSFEFYYAKL